MTRDVGLVGALSDAGGWVLAARRDGRGLASLRVVAPEAAAAVQAAVQAWGEQALELGFCRETVVAWHGAPRRVVLVGVGNAGRQEMFDAAVAAGRALSGVGGGVASLLALECEGADALVLEGHLAGAWVPPRGAALFLAPGAHGVPAGWVLAGDSRAGRDEPLGRARDLAEATAWVRWLVDLPPHELTPSSLAREAVRWAGEFSRGAVTASVWGAERLRAERCEAILGVGQGGSEPPCLVELTLEGEGPLVGLAGKGITYDSGGINIKRNVGEAAWMKSDMAAAASVAAAVALAGRWGGGPTVRALLPLAENLPGAGAMLPGAVLTHPDGSTTEVVDTDCEGRLVLADALARLRVDGAQTLVDVGTLTDSGSLGTAYWGCWGTSRGLQESLVAAGEVACEPGWALPLHPGYARLLDSRVADRTNAPADEEDAGRHAATYLRGFAGEVPWAHIDNGSSAWLERESWPWPEGPTAVPLRALAQWLCPEG